mgnify:CR=1 FL=1
MARWCMQPALSKADILAFQDDIRDRFLRAEIRHPIHLCDPNQLNHLLPIFQGINPQDWLFTSYRGIYHWLLKGVPPEVLLEYILHHGTMGFCDKERHIVSSAIVGGCLPIAVGVALGIKHRDDHANFPSRNWADTWPPLPRVWCFVGDMASCGGAFHEATQYAGHHDLPVRFIVEDNGLSTNTPTNEVWAFDQGAPWDTRERYLYQRNVPHVGAGQWVTFS